MLQLAHMVPGQTQISWFSKYYDKRLQTTDKTNMTNMRNMLKQMLSISSAQTLHLTCMLLCNGIVRNHVLILSCKPNTATPNLWCKKKNYSHIQQTISFLLNLLTLLPNRKNECSMQRTIANNQKLA